MKFSLGKKLFLSNGITFAVILAIILIVLERGQARQWEQHLYSRSHSFAKLATPELLKHFGGNFTPETTNYPDHGLELLSVNRDIVAFNLISPSGRVLYRSPLFPDYIDNSLPEEFSQEESSSSAASSWIETDTERYLLIVHPAYGPTGSHLIDVRYLFSFHSVSSRVSEIRREFLQFAIPAIVLVLLLVWFISRRISLPVKELTKGAGMIEGGDLSVRVKRSTNDEIGHLADAFNRMASQLEKHRRELTEKNDRLVSVQNQLIRSERLAVIGQIAAGISHEIDNPVGIILGHAELIKDDLDINSPLHEDIDEIIAECRRCKKITGGLLGLARPGTQMHEIFDPELLTTETITSLKTQKLFQDVIFTTSTTNPTSSTPPTPASAKGDRDRVRQILINLLVNAAQAMNGSGEIHINLTIEQENLTISVKDSGPGIDDTLSQKIFEPFFSTKSGTEGTGLGLAICRKLAEEMDGSLNVIPSHDGGIFTLTLPLSNET